MAHFFRFLTVLFTLHVTIADGAAVMLTESVDNNSYNTEYQHI